MTLEQIKNGMVDRRSYWSANNYHADGPTRGSITFSSWLEFYNEDWAIVDDGNWSENLICGWFLEKIDSDFSLIVYVISPRKGKFIPICINGLTDDDAPSIVKFIDDVRRKQNDHWSIIL